MNEFGARDQGSTSETLGKVVLIGSRKEELRHIQGHGMVWTLHSHDRTGHTGAGHA